jgi:hypothetical protein
MKRIRTFLLLVPILTLALVQNTEGSAVAQSQAAQPTIASMVDRQLTDTEKQVVNAAEAMPEDKFNFSPESLNMPGSEYKGVRTFAQQVKHIAASNYFLWASVTGEKTPEVFNDGKGPDNLKTKADIIKFLEDSFAFARKAAATLTDQNMLQPLGNSKTLRLQRAEFALSHAFDHYGQMVEYLRMNGIVPPASRGPSK